MSKTEAFRDEVERFIEARAITATAFGKAAIGDPNFVFDLRNGRAPRLDNVERVEEFMRTAPAQPATDDMINDRSAA